MKKRNGSSIVCWKGILSREVQLERRRPPHTHDRATLSHQCVTIRIRQCSWKRFHWAFGTLSFQGLYHACLGGLSLVSSSSAGRTGTTWLTSPPRNHSTELCIGRNAWAKEERTTRHAVPRALKSPQKGTLSWAPWDLSWQSWFGLLLHCRPVASLRLCSQSLVGGFQLSHEG